MNKNVLVIVLGVLMGFTSASERGFLAVLDRQEQIIRRQGRRRLSKKRWNRCLES